MGDEPDVGSGTRFGMGAPRTKGVVAGWACGAQDCVPQWSNALRWRPKSKDVHC